MNVGSIVKYEGKEYKVEKSYFKKDDLFCLILRELPKIEHVEVKITVID